MRWRCALRDSKFVCVPGLASVRIPFASSDVVARATSFMPSHAKEGDPVLCDGANVCCS